MYPFVSTYLVQIYVSIIFSGYALWRCRCDVGALNSPFFSALLVKLEGKICSLRDLEVVSVTACFQILSHA